MKRQGETGLTTLAIQLEMNNFLINQKKFSSVFSSTLKIRFPYSYNSDD